jgi:uncharacterized Rmd1/YagE family protein
MPTVEVHAYAFASTLPQRVMHAIAEDRSAVERRTKTQTTLRLGEQRWVVAYDFGAVVFFGVEEADRRRMVDKLLGQIGPEPHAPIHDEIVIEIKPEAHAPVTHFDRVTVPALDDRVIDIVALVLAQSAAMEYYEEDVDDLLVRLQDVTKQLETRGRFRGNVAELLRFVGLGMSTRNQVVYTLSLLDAPDLTWENERLDRLYRGLRGTFEIEDRYRALDHKLTMLQDNLELLVDLAQHRRTILLEIGVVALIAIEVVLFVWQMFGGPGH